jgi:hypothetical protein
MRRRQKRSGGIPHRRLSRGTRRRGRAGLTALIARSGVAMQYRLMVPQSSASRTKRFADFLFGERLFGEALERELAERPPRWMFWASQATRLVIVGTLLASILSFEQSVPLVGDWLSTSWRNLYIVWGSGLAVLLALEWLEHRHRKRLRRARSANKADSPD